MEAAQKTVFFPHWECGMKHIGFPNPKEKLAVILGIFTENVLWGKVIITFRRGNIEEIEEQITHLVGPRNLTTLLKNGIISQEDIDAKGDGTKT